MSKKSWIRRATALALLAGLGAWCLAAQTAPPVAEIQVPPLIVLAGHKGTVPVPFVITVASGYHIQSNHPTLDYLIPTSITLTPPAGITVGPAQWPAPVAHKFAFAPDTLAVYEGRIQVVVPLKSTLVTPGEHTVTGAFRYQACNESLCRPPVTVPLKLTVTVPVVLGH